MPTRKFADNKGMTDDLPLVKKFSKRWFASGEMIHPDRGINEDHTVAERRRRIG